MTDRDRHLEALQMYMMSDMEKLVWASVLALRMDEPDGGEAAADTCLQRLRELRITRDQRLEPEYEAARANLYMEFAEFAGWFPVQHRLHHRYDAGPYKPLPTRR